MEFKRWLEAFDFVTLRKKQIIDLATKYFGEPQVNPYGEEEPNTLDMDWTFDNGRSLGISWEYNTFMSKKVKKKEIISLSFEQENSTNPMSNKGDSTFYTAKNLQKGSIDFARNLKNFVIEVKKLGIIINYVTWGRRKDIYSKFLKKHDFQPMSVHTGSHDFWWS